MYCVDVLMFCIGLLGMLPDVFMVFVVLWCMSALWRRGFTRPGVVSQVSWLLLLGFRVPASCLRRLFRRLGVLMLFHSLRAPPKMRQIRCRLCSPKNPSPAHRASHASHRRPPSPRTGFSPCCFIFYTQYPNAIPSLATQGGNGCRRNVGPPGQLRFVAGLQKNLSVPGAFTSSGPDK